MIRSMTGYGGAESSRDDVNYALEIRSVNNRYFKAIIKLPDFLQSFEPDIDKLLRQRLVRGSINYQLKVKSVGLASTVPINVRALQKYLEQLRPLLDDPQVGPLDLSALMELPGICSPAEEQTLSRQQLWAWVENLSSRAIDRLLEMRRGEGQALAQDLLSVCKEVRRIAEDVKQKAPEVIVVYRKKLHARVNELLQDAQIQLQENDLLREFAIFAERCDISEEVIRLQSHLDQFEQLCGQEESAGRKLDFVTQEMLREVNTIGSKANDAAIARCVVELKGMVDRLKEQVQNIE